MFSIFQYILIAVSVAFSSAHISIDVERCKERVITKCLCGPGGNLTDVYVDGCRVISNDSLPCQPCPGSCNLFLNCEKCSKNECLSCPLGKTGPICKLFHSGNDSIEENNSTAVQSTEESASLTNGDTAKIVEHGFNQPMPNIVLDLSKFFRPATFQPFSGWNPSEDVIEFNAGKTLIAEVIPDNTPYVLENNLTDSNETVLDVGTAGKNKDVRSKNETDLGNEIDVMPPQKNDSVEFLTFGEEPSPMELSPVSDPVKISDGLQKDHSEDDESGLATHRSPNPSAEEDKRKILRHVLKTILPNEPDQLVLDDSHQQALAYAYQQDNTGNPAISSVQRDVNGIQNKAGTQNNDSHPRKTTPETKYVYIGANDENESKCPDAEYESSFSSEQREMTDEQCFDSDEEANLKSLMDPFTEGLRKISCKIFPTLPVCRGNEMTMDTVEQDNEENSEIQKNGFVGLEKEQPMASLDAIQQQNDQYFESHGKIHKPIPKNIGILDGFLSNHSHSDYFGQKYAMNLAPPSPKRDMIHGPPNADDVVVNFDQSLVPTPFDYFLGLVGPRITSFEEDRSHSGADRSHRSQKVQPAKKTVMNMLKPLMYFVLNPAIANNLVEAGSLMAGNDLQTSNSNTSFASLNFRNTEPKHFFSPEYQKTPAVKGLMLFAQITKENETAPRRVPGSVRGKNFEFEIPMQIPSLYADSKEFENLMKTKSPKHSKGSRRLRKHHNKRRRNGVKNHSSKCDPRIEDCTTIHGRNTQTQISRKTKHAMSSKAARKNPNNLGYVRIRYVKDDNEPIYDSVEISESSMPNKNAFYSQASEYDLQPQYLDREMENFTADYETAEASSESYSDSESNGRHFRFRRDLEATPFCPIPRDSRNGDLDCTIWSYKKTCTLVCHNGYTSPSQYFACQRSKNTWVPPMVSCKGGPEYEPLEESNIKLKQLDDSPRNLEDEDVEEEPPSPRDGDSNNGDYDEKSSGEMGVRDQDEDNPVKTHAHKKNKGRQNKEEFDEKSSGEMGVRDQDGDEEGAATVTSARPGKTHAHKKKAHHNSVKEHDENKEVEDAHKAPKAQGKGDAPTKHPEPVPKAAAKSEEESKEETKEEVPKTGSDEEQAKTGSEEEESSNEEVDESPKDQEVQEVAQNDVGAEYDEGYERRK